MYSYKLYSHPDVPLIKHLKNVGDRCQNLIENKDIKFSYSKSDILYVAKVMGYTHDLGKATSYFQKYLLDMNNQGKSDVDKTLRSHGMLSALNTYLQLKSFDNNLAMIAFIIVRKHHGDLDNASIEYSFDDRSIKRQKEEVKKQLSSIDKEEMKNIIQELSLKHFEDDEIINALDEIQERGDIHLDDILENVECQNYILYKFLFSTLIYSDKEDAIFKTQHNIEYDIPSNIVDTYKKIKFKGTEKALNNIRNEIYDDVLNSISTQYKIMSITVPTGTGKTLTALAAALKLREELKKNMKIIYCLPFMSVIDQNYNSYCDVIKTVLGEEVTSEKILKHHHLTDYKYIDESLNFEDNQSKFLIENWDSQIVVTTFMQFFNCIFSNRNSELIKYNNISNSIVLLDEVQSLPYIYWNVINSVFKIMAEKLNVYFIFITATQPLIFKENEIKELAENNKEYFKSFKRTKLHINMNPINKEDFYDEMEKTIEINKDKNILIILNTIATSQEMYEKIEYMKSNECEIYFLSTGIVPKERQKRIDDIKESKKRKIVISTQLIEAGVDIDMDIVIRDMATLDSINQSAGRCNREYRGEYLGDVYIYNLVNDNGREYSKFIYDKFLLDKTKETLSGKDIIYEENYLDLNKEYFNLVSKNMSNDKSLELISNINKLEFKDIKEKFQLIENQNKISVFIETDDKAIEVWNKYQNIKKLKEPFKMKEEFDKIKKEFYENVISVFKNKVKDSEEFGMVHITKEELKGSYDFNTGYILNQKDQII